MGHGRSQSLTWRQVGLAPAAVSCVGPAGPEPPERLTLLSASGLRAG